jgi:hypothetical protein
MQQCILEAFNQHLYALCIKAAPHYCLLSLLLQQPSSLAFDPSSLLTATVLWELKHMVRDSLLFKHLFSRVGNIDILHQDVPFV